MTPFPVKPYFIHQARSCTHEEQSRSLALDFVLKEAPKRLSRSIQRLSKPNVMAIQILNADLSFSAFGTASATRSSRASRHNEPAPVSQGSVQDMACSDHVQLTLEAEPRTSA